MATRTREQEIARKAAIQNTAKRELAGKMKAQLLAELRLEEERLRQARAKYAELGQRPSSNLHWQLTDRINGLKLKLCEVDVELAKMPKTPTFADHFRVAAAKLLDADLYKKIMLAAEQSLVAERVEKDAMLSQLV